MQKVAGERYVYKFVCDPDALFSMAFPDNHRSILKSELSSPIKSSDICSYYGCGDGGCGPINMQTGSILSDHRGSCVSGVTTSAGSYLSNGENYSCGAVNYHHHHQQHQQQHGGQHMKDNVGYHTSLGDLDGIGMQAEMSEPPSPAITPSLDLSTPAGLNRGVGSATASGGGGGSNGSNYFLQHSQQPQHLSHPSLNPPQAHAHHYAASQPSTVMDQLSYVGGHQAMMMTGSSDFGLYVHPGPPTGSRTAYHHQTAASNYVEPGCVCWSEIHFSTLYNTIEFVQW